MKPLRFFFLLLALASAVPLRAAAGQLHYLSAGAVDATALLAPPPVRGSVEDKLDFDNTLAVHTAATPADIARGDGENKLTIFHFARAIGLGFAPGKFPLTEKLFKHVEDDAKAVTDEAKKFFKRPRPYHIAPALFPHSIEHEDPTHYSYPSGHSTRGTLFALLLAELVPGAREALLAKGRESGWLRVQGGVHYPTDIQAGRVLGQALARELLAGKKFQRDLAAARAELGALKP